jgi:hypothetical protein
MQTPSVEHSGDTTVSGDRRFRVRASAVKSDVLCEFEPRVLSRGSGRRCELHAVAARDPVRRLRKRARQRVRLLRLCRSPALGAPRTTGHRCATSSPRRATRDRLRPGPSQPHATRTRPCGAEPSCGPGLRECGARGSLRTRDRSLDLGPHPLVRRTNWAGANGPGRYAPRSAVSAAASASTPPSPSPVPCPPTTSATRR